MNGVRIGKGSGYGEFEFAILREFNKVGGNTAIITIVHDFQVINEELEPEPYDLPAD
ncbi:MAG: 5-formyltetrahydrofolate cyclo-ligase [Candidatus Bathyarchaeia archaeon]